MHFVRALVSGPWKAVDVFDRDGLKFGERTLVMALQTGRWSIDNRGVDVVPGLCVSFRDFPDAQYFLLHNPPRASWIAVEPGMLMAFEAEYDANFFVNAKLATRVSRRDGEAEMAAEEASYKQRLADEAAAELAAQQQMNSGELVGENSDMGKETKMMPPPVTPTKKGPAPKGGKAAKGK